MTDLDVAEAMAAGPDDGGTPLRPAEVGVWPRPVVGESLTRRLRSFARPQPHREPLIASDANKCARKIGFRLFGTPADIAYTPEDLDKFSDGDFFDAVAGEVLARNLGARLQLPFNWMPDAPVHGKADAGYRDAENRKVIVEVKSTSTKGFDRQAGVWSSVPPHPKTEWLLQAGMGACCPQISAELVHILLVDSDGEGPNKYRTVEWLVSVDEPLLLPDWDRPRSVRQLVLGEIERQEEVLAKARRGVLAARVVPDYGLVADPPPYGSKGTSPWNCAYCSHQPTCAALAAGDVDGFGEPVR